LAIKPGRACHAAISLWHRLFAKIDNREVKNKDNCPGWTEAGLWEGIGFIAEFLVMLVMSASQSGERPAQKPRQPAATRLLHPRGESLRSWFAMKISA